jgi:hypothetical protein
MHMFTLLNTGCISHKWDVLHRKTMCFLTVFLFACLAYGQSEKVRIDIGEIYQARLEEHLFPNIDTLVANEIVLFYVIPSFATEYSIRIIERGDQSYIEGRSLEKSLWYELLRRFTDHDDKPFSVNVSLNSMPISNKFKERMLDAFNDLMISNKAIGNCGELQFDGIIYVFSIFDINGKVSTIESHSPEPGIIENDLANLFTQMANDLKSHSFEEVKYIAKLNSF